MNAKRLQEIRDAVNEITAGTWYWIGHMMGQYHLGVLYGKKHILTVNDKKEITFDRNDGAFIAAAPDYVRELLISHDEQVARIAALERALGVIRGMADLGNYRNIALEHSQAKLREIQEIADEARNPKEQT